ncbi:n/a [Trypanosoma theileri]|uniref:N/a n=1 Tax=Trypanosoma theileri TaxID=67003 RepID=A0A1X0P532_9TRYP|nr:n/a [Trypanosoma theileri]ORC92054.1 n/a [Trypanosoma theileri]
MYEMETFRERTLANRYQPRQHLPPNFPHVLKEYAREVLRAQPDDVLQWSADYFKRLALETDPLQARQPPSEHYVPVVEDQEREMLLQRLIKAFAEHDNDNTGVLSTQEIKKVLLESFELTPSQALYVLTSTALVENDTVDYKSFANECVRAVQFFQETHHEFGVGELEDATVHGLSRRDVEQEFLRIFRYVDEADTGLLPIEQYFQALLNAPYHLTNRDLRLLRIEAARNAENEVDYESELAYMFDRLLLAEQFFLFDEDA